MIARPGHKRRCWLKPVLMLLPMLVFFLTRSALVQAQPPADAARHFDTTVAPLLARRCLDCHDGPRPKGGLNLRERPKALAGGKNGLAIVPGKAGESLLWKHVDAGRMPPKKPLREIEKAILKEWIARGAVWGADPIDPFRYTSDHRAGYDWWSLQPIVSPRIPVVDLVGGLPAHPIDAFLLGRLVQNKLEPSPPADRRTLIRRVTFDLIGLPPTPGEVSAFLKDDRADAYERLVDRLLASPRYGERWARHWLDVVRFGESNGFEHDELRKNAWPYRDWVIQALNQDMPYDEFARLQLAGDILKPRDSSAIEATGFLVAGSFDTVGQAQQSAAMKAVVRQDELEDIVGTIGQTFLGLTVHCARCHDHKFDPVRQSEYYRLTAALAGVRHGERDITSTEARKAREALQQERREKIATLGKELADIDKPVREKIIAERKANGNQVRPGPEPRMAWDFTNGPLRSVELHGDARFSSDGLVLPGQTGYADAGVLTKSLKARTLAVAVRLDDLRQRGGAAISLQTLDGRVFDAIVFGEQEVGMWMAGSDGFQRTRSFQGQKETQGKDKAVHFAIAYHADGTIAGYRNGEPFGKTYKSQGPIAFEAGKAQVIFGLRHTPAGGNKHLRGVVLKAEVHDRALTPEEVAAIAGAGHNWIAEAEIVRHLDDTSKVRRARINAEITRLQEQSEKAPKTLAYAVSPRPPEVAHMLLRGDPASKGPVVTPGAVSALASLKPDFGLTADASDAERRRALADWITSPQNPLFARVMVNRLWQYHFGAGLVDTPSDFGFNGGRPSHPELLDWLAAEFQRGGYRLKAIHRLIVTSAAYRQSSRYRADAAKIDSGNRLLARKSPMRLEAEALRDAMLHVAGKLNLDMGGPGYQDFKLAIRGGTYYYLPLDDDSPDLFRRSVYRTWARSGRNALLDNLDCPDPSTTTPKRALTNTPLQALTLLNNSFVLRIADHFAARLKSGAGDDADRQVSLAYRLAYGREPDANEVAAARSVVNEHGLSILCRAIFNSSEFLYVD